MWTDVNWERRHSKIQWSRVGLPGCSSVVMQCMLWKCDDDENGSDLRPF